jgi:hypothetical protein
LPGFLFEGGDLDAFVADILSGKMSSGQAKSPENDSKPSRH